MNSLVVFLIGLLASVSVVSAEAPTVSGQVRLVDGSAVAGAQVLLFDVEDLRRGVLGRATTDGSGRFALPLTGFDKLSPQLGGSGLPQGFALGQNYPNPFNPSTVIPYQLASAAHVRLDVFNVLGQRVATLVDGAHLAGFHSVRWDATDRFGRSVASGVYLYRLLVDGSVQQTKRMVLVDGQAGVASPGAGVGAGVGPVAASVAPVVSVAGDYGLVIGGAGLVPYVDGAFAVREGMASVAFVVERAGSPQGAGLARPVLGDVTGDGRVNRADALVVMTHHLDGSVGALPAGAIPLGDVTGDGRVDGVDASAILRYAADPLDGSLPSGIGRVMPRGKRAAETGAHGIGEALSLFGAVADALKDNIETDYQNGRKWLGFLNGGALVNATIWVDLADYAGVTPEGRGDAGDQWITIWIDIGAALDWPPIAAGVVALDFEPNTPDPWHRSVHIKRGTLSTVTTEVSLVEESLSDAGAQRHFFNVEVGGFEEFDRLVSPHASAAELQINSLGAFEIKKSVFDFLVKSALTVSSGILSPADFRGIVTGLIGRFLRFDRAGLFSALKDLKELAKDLKELASGGVRRFTSTDSGESRDIDGYFNGVYSSLGHVENAPVETGDTLIVRFQNTGNSPAGFRIEARVLTDGWRIDSLRPEDRFWVIKNFNLWSGEADMGRVDSGEQTGTAWQIFSSAHAPELGRVRFYLYHDRLVLSDTLLDSLDVIMQRSPNLGDLSRVADLRMQRFQVRRNGYFLFSLSEPGEVGFTLSGLNRDASLLLVRSRDGETIASSTHEGIADEELALSLAAGTYYIRVFSLPGSSEVLHYELRYSNSTVSIPDDPLVDEGGGGGGTTGEERSFSLPGGGEMEFVWIEPGVFQMGSPSGERGRDSDEGPVHEVEISRGFWLGKYEVTQGEWESVMGTTPWSGESYVQEHPSHPAVYISWNDVQAFVDKLNDAAGSAVYRLPSEAEWEYACRAGTSTRWSFGDDESELTHYAWYHANACDVDECYGHAVGTKRPNPWGLYDMHGNVWEWVQDRYSSSYYNSSPRVDPPGPTSGSIRVKRGGGFSYVARNLRSAQRGNASPGFRGYWLGARLLRIR